MISNILYPIEYILQIILEISYRLSSNYGIALIMLSAVVSTLLLPIYSLADKWKEKEKIHQKRMETDIQSIKKHYRGVERYYSIRAVYRIYGYSPLFTFRTAFGFLIQIPFFFAAYKLLSQYTAFQGVSFGIIQNLGKPDGILYGINVLPFVMTIINIVAGIFYIKEWNKNEIMQLFGLSLFFLIVLYTSPSALVLYWTMNNSYSLIKYVWINRKHISDRVSQSKVIVSQFCSSAQMLTIIKVLIVLGGYFLVNYVLHVDRSSISGQYSLYAGIWIFFVCMLCGYSYSIGKKGIRVLFRVDMLVSYLFFVIFVVLGIYLLKQLYTATLPKSIGIYSVVFLGRSMTLNNVGQLLIIVLLFSLVCGLCRVLWANRNNMFMRIVSGQGYTFKLYAIMLLYFVCIGTIAIPVSFYITAPEFLGGNIALLLGYTVVLAVVVYGIFFLLGYGVFRLKGRRISHILTTVMTVLTVVSVFYGFMLNLKIGVLRGSRFSDDNILITSQMFANIFEIVMIFLLIYSIYYYFAYIKKYLIIFLSITIFLIGGNIVRLVIQFEPIVNDVSLDENTLLPEYHNKITSFSKEKNILYVILDAFSADLLEDILEKYPHLFTGLDGFTWYKNTVSISEQTYYSMSAIIAGYNYAPNNIGKFNRTMKENIYQSRVYWSEKLPDYDISYVNGHWFDADRLDTLENVTAITTGYDYIPYYKKEFPSIQSMITLWEYFKEKLDIYKIINLSVFRIVPFHIKQRIYSREGDIFTQQTTSILRKKFIPSYLANEHLRNEIVLKTIVTTSNTNNLKPTFKLFWLDAHGPYNLEEDCTTMTSEYFSSGTIDIMSLSLEHAPSQLKCLLESIITWIQWMKIEGIYDISKIIIASDHGSSFHLYSGNTLDSNIFALLMVKDFNERGKLKVSQQLMSNADIPSIVASGIPEYSFPELQQDPIKTKNERTVKHFASKVDFNLDLTDIKLKYTITVRDNVYDKEKWEYEYFNK